MEYDYANHPYIIAISTLQSRGFTLALGAGGKILVTPASRLTEPDRKAIRVWRNEILARLQGRAVWSIWTRDQSMVRVFRAGEAGPSESQWDSVLNAVVALARSDRPAWIRGQWWQGDHLHSDVYYPSNS